MVTEPLLDPEAAGTLNWVKAAAGFKPPRDGGGTETPAEPPGQPGDVFLPQRRRNLLHPRRHTQQRGASSSSLRQNKDGVILRGVSVCVGGGGQSVLQL